MDGDGAPRWRLLPGATLGPLGPQSFDWRALAEEALGGGERSLHEIETAVLTKHPELRQVARRRSIRFLRHFPPSSTEPNLRRRLRKTLSSIRDNYSFSKGTGLWSPRASHGQHERVAPSSPAALFPSCRSLIHGAMDQAGGRAVKVGDVYR